jgi:7-cyano-7-deazaguanine synthase in queuosine biosynthesis
LAAAENVSICYSTQRQFGCVFGPLIRVFPLGKIKMIFNHPAVRHLVMLSGGPDSVWPLKMLLTRTQDEVVALHVTLVDESGRHKFEDAACRAIVKHCCKEFRALRYETAKLIPPRSAHSYADLTVLACFAAMLCAGERGYRSIWFGAEINGGYGEREVACREIFSACMRVVATNETPAICFPEGHATKRDLLHAIGDELWSLTWSCRHPIGDAPCGNCLSCVNRRRAEEGCG